MSLVGLIITLVIIGVVLYICEQLLPLDPTIRLLIRLVVVLIVLLWLLQVFGIVGPTIPLSRVR